MNYPNGACVFSHYQGNIDIETVLSPNGDRHYLKRTLWRFTMHFQSSNIQPPNIQTPVVADNSIASLFVGTSISMFGFLLLIILLA
jgi:hypothetical protein